MTNRKLRKRLTVLLPAIMLTASMSQQISAAEMSAQMGTEIDIKAVTATVQTQAEQPAETVQVQTEAPVETPDTEPIPTDTEPEVPDTESETPDTEPEVPDTEPETPDTEPETPGTETETPTEVPDTEPETEAPTEAPDTEPETDSGTESESESEKETEKKKKETETESEAREGVPGFSVDPNAYPAVNITENTKEIYHYLTEKMGFNHAAACGILANIHLESNFNQLAVGDGGTSFGICQWHLGRLTNLMNVCSSMGLDYRTLEGQLAYLETELSGGYAHVLEYLRSVPDTAQGAYSAAYYWCMYFEIPSETEARSVQRGNLAMHEYFPQNFEMDAVQETVGNGKTIYETTSNLNVRMEPSTEAERLGMLAKGATIDVCEESKEWYRIIYKDGFGYVNREYVKVTVKEAEAMELYVPGLAEMKSSSEQENTIDERMMTMMHQEMKLSQMNVKNKTTDTEETEMESEADAEVQTESEHTEETVIGAAEGSAEIVYKKNSLPFHPLMIQTVLGFREV